MKYKLEIWKYSRLNTTAWEKKLNERACQGWKFWSKSTLPPQFALYVRTEEKKRYTVDIYKSKAEGYAYEQDLESFVDFYRQLGWEMVYKDSDGCYIFEANEGIDPPPAYQNEEERRRQSQSNIGIGNDVYWLIYFSVLMIFWAWNGMLSETSNMKILIPFFILVTPTLVGAVINIAYVKGKGDKRLIRAQDFQNRLSGWMMIIMLAYSLAWSINMIAMGGFAEAWDLFAGSFYSRLLLIIVPAAVPLSLLGQAIDLLAKKQLLGQITYIVVLIGIMGSFYI